jgi:hypothetical protein
MTAVEKVNRRGFPIYSENPFMTGISLKTKKRKLTVARGTSLTDVDTGEQELTTTIAQIKEVDEEQYIKVYSGKIKFYFDLSSAGFKVFMLLLQSVQQTVGLDRVYMTHQRASKSMEAMGGTLSRAVYDRGVNDLCAKKVIAACDESGWFFINPAIIFNGDRARFVEEYRKVSTESLRQASLPGIDDDDQEF